MARDLVCVDDVDHAHARAHLRPDRVARRLHLSRDHWTVSRAVSFLAAKNAVRHARTPSFPHASLDSARLRMQSETSIPAQSVVR